MTNKTNGMNTTKMLLTLKGIWTISMTNINTMYITIYKQKETYKMPRSIAFHNISL